MIGVEADADEAADTLWRIVRYAANQRRPRGWQAHAEEADHHAALLLTILNEYQRLAGDAEDALV